MALLDAKNINISFSGLQILFDVDFSLNAGEIHCLCGENGAGKSTLVKILTGIYAHYSGTVAIDGREVRLLSPRTAREHGIYAVQQHRDLVPTMNAYENIFMGNELFYGAKGNQRLNFKRMREEALLLISKFGIDLDVEKPVAELKVSEQGIVAICKALAAKSRILLIDEASAPLDDAERQVLYGTLRKLKNEGKGIVYITHHLEEVFNIGDKITVLRNGENVTTASIAAFDREALIRAMTGDLKTYHAAEKVTVDHSGETPVIEFAAVESMNLRSVSFRAYQGEIIGFAGLEGSFKDEIASIAFGIARSTSGSVKFNGKEIASRHPIHSVRKGIGYVPTDRKNAGLVTCRSVSENIILTAINKSNSVLTNSRWIRKTVAESIRKLGVRTSGPQQLVEYLSGGNQQKVLIAKWLEAKVKALFLVEPTEGIDVGARADLYGILKGMAEEGKTLILFTSDIDELLTLCVRIFTMVEGRIIHEYTANEANKHNILSDILTKHQEERGERFA